MKIRVKLGSRSQILNFEGNDASSVTLARLEEATASHFQLQDQEFHLSLNKKDALLGSDVPLAEFGVVSGDLLHIIGPGLQDGSGRHQDGGQNRIQGLASHSAAHTSQNGHPSAPAPRSEQHQVAQSESAAANRVESDMDMSQATQSDSSTSLDINRFLEEPLVVRESTGQQVPALLSQLYHSANCSSSNDALWVALHTLMLESGFLPAQTEDPTTMPEDWKKSGYYTCTYDFSVSTDTVEKCTLVGVPIGSSMAIHGLSQGKSNVKTEHLQVKSADFVRTLSQDVPETYRALDRLSHQFKDTICLPLINGLATAAGFPQQEGLLALPYEAKLRIMSLLDPRSLVQLGKTCHEFSAIYRDRTVWRILFIRAFGRPDDCSLRRDWYELFKVRYRQWLEEQESRFRLFHFDETEPPWGFPGPGPFRPILPSVPHMIGGDYDLNPGFGAGIPNPMGGRTLQGPRLPPGAIPDSFSPLLGEPRMPGRPQPRRDNMTGSPFSSGIRGPFNFL